MNPDRYRGYRVAVVGGCQALGLRRWLERMLPGASVDSWHVNASPDWTPELVASSIAGHNLVISQVPDGVGSRDLDFSRLRTSREMVVFLPTFVFTGLHPDVVQCGVKTNPGSLLNSSFFKSQSAITIAAYHLGVSPTRVPRLFNALVFDQLGYFAAFNQARTAAGKIFAEHGYDLSDAIETWMKGGSFMYFENHPHIRVLGTLARLVLEKTGLELADPREDRPPPDDLSGSLQWPVYPALARRLGIAGSLSFVRAIPHTPPGQARELSVEMFARETYRMLEESAPIGFEDNPRVDAAIDALRNLLGDRGMSAVSRKMDQ